MDAGPSYSYRHENPTATLLAAKGKQARMLFVSMACITTS
jgi:hypothetical protein